MTLLTRRDLAFLAAAAAAAASNAPAHAQNAPYGGQGVNLKVIVDQELAGFPLQMTRLTLIEFAPGSSITRHHHPAAQEVVFGMDGGLMIDVEGEGKKIIKAGDVLVIPTSVVHFPHAEGTSAKVLAIHSITDKSKPFRVDAKT
jgi:quercetin dioxygenase-like cupin family protein